MSVADLIEMLRLVPEHRRDDEVICWLPGSRIRLGPSFFLFDGRWAVEGNLEPGSALCRDD